MKKLPAFILLALLPSVAHGSVVIELSTFPKSPDPVVQRCYEQAMAATRKGKALCVDKGWGDFWVCPASREMRAKPLQQCRAEAKNAKDRVGMLYLLGLLHQDFRLHSDDSKCPELYRYQEGSAICVYTNDHFDQLLREFPKSAFADMAAFQRAEEEYRYYECEGTLYCSIENQITGWIGFLEIRPRSPFADHATDTIIKAFGRLDRLSDPKLDLSREYPDSLLEDIERLTTIAAKLSPGNRATLQSSLKKAKPVLLELKEKRAADRAQADNQ